MRKFTTPPEETRTAGLIRRLAAMGYDALLCIALLMVTTGLYMMIAHAIYGAEQYKAMTESGKTISDPLLSSVLFITLYFFFAYFWVRNGQTLGMQVWHIRVQNPDQTSISWSQALVRYFVAFFSFACLGFGYFWILIDRQGRSWQCIASDSEVVRIPKPQK